MSIVYAIIGLILLVIGGELLVRASVGLSFKLKLSKLVIGMTVVSFATSAPELIVSMQSAFDGHPDLALSNVVGSNIANIALVLGITVMITPLYVDLEFFKLNWPKMMLASLLLYFFLQNDLVLSRIEGLILFILLIVFIIVLIHRARKLHITAPDDLDDSLEKTSNAKLLIWLVLGGAALWFGSKLLIDGAIEIATTFGVSENVIGVSMVAFGTSIPELAASVIAALRKEKAISLGNLIGSNIFNIGSVLGITAMIMPIQLKDTILLENDIFWMLAIALVLVPMALFPTRNKLSRFEGLLLFSAYIGFISLKILA
ncbi:MAG TPA: calcium/sodium antiporter [Lutibacter sp.]|nr:calcium/sodium antiporter [Lutibacter sp.]